jgi:hypothetical protein
MMTTVVVGWLVSWFHDFLPLKKSEKREMEKQRKFLDLALFSRVLIFFSVSLFGDILVF